MTVENVNLSQINYLFIHRTQVFLEIDNRGCRKSFDLCFDTTERIAEFLAAALREGGTEFSAPVYKVGSEHTY